MSYNERPGGFDGGRRPYRGGRGGGGGGGRQTFEPYARPMRGGGGGPRHGGGSHHHRSHGGPPPPPPESRERQCRTHLIKLADQDDFNTSKDMPQLAGFIQSHWKEAKSGVFDGFAIGMTEQPHKLPYYAALLLLLSRDQHRIEKPSSESVNRLLERFGDKGGEATPEDASLADATTTGQSSSSADQPTAQDADHPVKSEVAADTNGAAADEEKPSEDAATTEITYEPKISSQVLEYLEKRFQSYMQETDWLKIRLSLTFFGHLVSIGLISSASFLRALQSLGRSFEDVNGVRTRKASRCIAAGLLRAGPTFYSDNKDAVDALIEGIARVAEHGLPPHAEGSSSSRALCTTMLNPRQMRSGQPDQDLLQVLVNALQDARSNGFKAITFLPEPYQRFPLPEDEVAAEAFELSEVSLPSGDEGKNIHEGWISAIYPSNDIHLNDGRVPDPATADGWVMLSIILDMIHLYEVNRTECAKTLLSLPSFVLPDTFVPPPPKPAPGEEAPAPQSGEWVLATTLVSVILACVLRLPDPAHKVVYHTALIRELCLLEGAKIAPPLGLAVRNFYSSLDEGVDPELIRRFAEWFATHLSNFVFQWLWKDWQVDLDLPRSHPKRAFMFRIIELEVRLAYLDRIEQTLPEKMLDEKATGAAALQDTDPSLPLAEGSPEMESFEVVTKQLRERTPAETVLENIREMAQLDPADAIPLEYRQIGIYAVLQLGARSFSHFLNATERYTALLRGLAADAAQKRDLLICVAQYWKHNTQTRVVTMDKYLQYGLVETDDVIHLIFGWLSEQNADAEAAERTTAWTDFHAWELLSMVLDKAMGRVFQMQRKVSELEEEDEAAKRRWKAQQEARAKEGDGEREDSKQDGEEVKQEEAELKNTTLRSAKSRLEALKAEQHRAFLLTTDLFLRSLSNGSDLTSLIELDDLREVTDPQIFDTLARLGWYREYVRRYGSHIRKEIAAEGAAPSSLDTLLSEDVDMEDAGSTGKALLKKIWLEGVQA